LRWDAEYWSALGRFIHECAAVETALHTLVLHMTGVSRGVAKAIFSGLRTDGAMDFIRRLNTARAGGPDAYIAAEIDAVFPQIKAITQTRNDIVHLGGHGVPRETDNYWKALTSDQVIRRDVNPETLYAMTLDLIKARMHLGMMITPATIRTKSSPNFPVLKHAWLYTPPQPPKPRKDGKDRPRSPAQPK